MPANSRAGEKRDLGSVPQRATAGELVAGRAGAVESTSCGPSVSGPGLPARNEPAASRSVPAHAAAADLLQRQPGVERHRREQLRGRPSAARSTSRSRPTRSASSRDHRPAGAAPPPGGRSRRAGAAGDRRGARPCPPSRRSTSAGKTTSACSRNALGQQARRGRSRAPAPLSAALPQLAPGRSAQRVDVQQVERGSARRRRGRRRSPARVRGPARRRRCSRAPRSAARPPRAGPRPFAPAGISSRPGAAALVPVQSCRRSAAAPGRPRALGAGRESLAPQQHDLGLAAVLAAQQLGERAPGRPRRSRRRRQCASGSSPASSPRAPAAKAAPGARVRSG